MTGSLHGSPTVVLDSSIITNTETALNVIGGTATVWNSVIGFNYNGVVQSSAGFIAGGAINLNGGLDGGTDGGTSVICSSFVESIYGSMGLPGVNVLNANGNPLVATNVSWDTAGPDHFHCGANLANCTCSDAGPACVNTPGADDMDAVTENGPVLTSGNIQSPLAVARGCQ